MHHACLFHFNTLHISQRLCHSIKALFFLIIGRIASVLSNFLSETADDLADSGELSPNERAGGLTLTGWCGMA